MRKFNLFWIVITLLTITACSEQKAPASVVGVSDSNVVISKKSASYGQRSHKLKEQRSERNQKQGQYGLTNIQQRSKYLAYSHNIRVKTPQSKLQESFEQILQFCSDDDVHQCTILSSRINTGKYPSGEIKVRLKPEGVNTLLNVSEKHGKIVNQSTDTQDLQGAIIDNQKRLEMLQKYQTRLLELENKSNNDVNSLIKIADELSKVQSSLEYSQGNKAKLLQRTTTDIVTISLQPDRETSFWSPITESFSSFGDNLSDGISQTITAIAYLLPWSLLFLLFFYLIRIIWRKTRNRDNEK